MKPATEILLSTAFALTPEENWTTRAMARDRNGYDLFSQYSEFAVSWCVVAAMDLSVDALGLMPNRKDAEDALIAAVEADPSTGRFALAEFNNTHTHAEVLDALYRAAALAESA